MATRSPLSAQVEPFCRPRRDSCQRFKFALAEARGPIRRTSVQCDEPVAGSSGMPCAGAKKRDTKSTPFLAAAPSAIAAQQSDFGERGKVGRERARLPRRCRRPPCGRGASAPRAACRRARRADRGGGSVGTAGRAGKSITSISPRRAHRQRAGLERAKVHARALRLETAEHDMPGGERRVAAQIDLDRRREPAQRVVARPRARRRRSRRDCSPPRSPASWRPGSHRGSGQIAAGLPPNSFSANAST